MLRPASLRWGLGHRTEHHPAGQGARGGEKRTPQSGGGLAPGSPCTTTFLRVPAPGSAAPVTPTPAWLRDTARQLQLRPWRVWKGGFGAGGGSGGGPGGGAVSAAGPSSASPGLSLSLLLPPAPGGARHGGAGARQARYGDVEIGEVWCGEVGWGRRGSEDWRGEKRRNPG